MTFIYPPRLFFRLASEFLEIMRSPNFVYGFVKFVKMRCCVVNESIFTNGIVLTLYMSRENGITQA